MNENPRHASSSPEALSRTTAANLCLWMLFLLTATVIQAPSTGSQAVCGCRWITAGLAACANETSQCTWGCQPESNCYAGCCCADSGANGCSTANGTCTFVAHYCPLYVPSATPSVTPSSTVTPSRSPTPSSTATASPAPANETSVLSPVPAIRVQLDATTPRVVVSPEDHDAAVPETSVSLEFVGVEEVDSEGLVVRTVDLRQEGWRRTQGADLILFGNATGEFVTSVADNATTLTYSFFTFSKEEQVSLANNYTFMTDPSFLKFSFSLAGWMWSSTGTGLRFKIAVHPPFGSSARLDDTPQAGMTSVWLLDTQWDQHGVLLRFLDFALASIVNEASTVVPCAVEAHHNDSTLAITFPYFGNGTLTYDPDITVLVGGTSKGSDDNMATVIAVAVAVPVAVVAVVLIITGIVIVGAILKKRANKANMVQFESTDALAPGHLEDDTTL